MSSKCITDPERQAYTDDRCKTPKRTNKICECLTTTLRVFLILILPANLFAIGSMYLVRCPAENYFAVYALVAGLMGLLNPLLWYLESREMSISKYDRRCAFIYTLFALLHCLISFWLLISAYRIYSAPAPKDDTLCKVYFFTIWSIIPIYFVVAMSTVIFYCCFAICTKIKEEWYRQ